MSSPVLVIIGFVYNALCNPLQYDDMTKMTEQGGRAR